MSLVNALSSHDSTALRHRDVCVLVVERGP